MTTGDAISFAGPSNKITIFLDYFKICKTSYDKRRHKKYILLLDFQSFGSFISKKNLETHLKCTKFEKIKLKQSFKWDREIYST